MKTLRTHSFLECALATLVLLCATVQADPLPGGMWIDEYGNGLYYGKTLPWSKVTSDLGGGITESVLVYWLPRPTALGDVVLKEPGAAEWSDVIRFTMIEDSGVLKPALMFLSDGADGLDSLADLPVLPTSLQANSVFVEEAVSGGTFYLPEPGQPGWGDFGGGYHLYSEGNIPSFPDGGATLGLVGVGFAAALALRKKWK